jgi:ferredoxin
MKLQVDVPRCMGNARCWAVAPELFELNDDGYLDTELVDVPVDQEDAARNAVDSCPEQIISVQVSSGSGGAS